MNASERKLIQQKLGQRVCELRHHKQWPQEHFADLCNVHRGHMGQIELGESKLTLEVLSLRKMYDR